MFEEADSLGVSQGQGRGFAQVFDSTYNPVFKEETARLIEKDKAGKKEIDRQLESIDGAVWFRDEQLVQEKIFDLQKYAQDNYRSIGRGNTNEALEYKKKITDIKAVVTQSKLAEQETTKLLYELNKNENKYDRNKSKESLKSFLAAPGNFDISQLQLFANFDAMKHQKDLAGLVGKITQDTQLLPGFKDLNDNTIYRKFENTIDSEIERNARSLWLDLPESGREHYDNDLNKYIDIAKSYAKQSKSQIVKGKTPELSLSKEAEKKPNQIILNKPISFSQKVGATKTPIYGEDYEAVGFTDSETVSLASTGFNVPDVASYTPNQIKNMNGVVFSVKGAYQAEKTKEGLKLKSGVKLKDGQNFIDALIEDQGTASFTAQSIDLVPVFKKGKKVMATTKNGRKINLSNTIISKEMLEEGKIHDIVLSDDNVEYVPYVFGNYDKIIDEDTQTNFSAGVPYSEYALSMQNQNNTRNELTRFEKQEDVQNELLKTYSFTEGNKKAGIKTKSQPTQTKKAPDSTQKQTKIKPMTRDEFNAFAKSKGKVATDDDYKKYLNKLEE